MEPLTTGPNDPHFFILGDIMDGFRPVGAFEPYMEAYFSWVASNGFALPANRWDVWTSAVAMAVDHPLFGVGVDNFQNFDPDYGNHGINHAHNLFLNIAAERGIPALLAFGFVIFALFRTVASSLRTAQSTMDRAISVGFLATFAGYLVHSIFEVSYYDHKVLLLFWLLVGVAASLPRLISSASQPNWGRQSLREVPPVPRAVHAS